MSNTSIPAEATRFSVYLSVFRIGKDNRTFTPVVTGLFTLDEAIQDATRLQAPARFMKTLTQLYETDGGMVVLRNRHEMLFCAQLDDPGHLDGHFQQSTVNVLEPGEILTWHRREAGQPLSPGQVVTTTLQGMTRLLRTKVGGPAIMPREAWEMLEYLLEFKRIDQPVMLVVDETLNTISRLRVKGEPLLDRTEAAAAEADRDEDDDTEPNPSEEMVADGTAREQWARC